MSLLTIAQNVANAVGLQEPTEIAAGTNQDAKRFYRLINRSGLYLRDYHDWAALRKEHTFTTVSGTSEYALPSDFRRYISMTSWDRSNNWRMKGSLSPDEWQYLESGLVANAQLRKSFTIKKASASGAKAVYINPTPSAAENLVIEYISDQWCESASATGQTAMTADTDVARLDEFLIELHVQYLLKSEVGLMTQEDWANYEDYRDRLIAQDAPRRNLNFGQRRVFLAGNIPDTGVGG